MTHHSRYDLPNYSVWKKTRKHRCQEWNSYEAFIADMGVMPSNCQMLVRYNEEMPYSKENCKWGRKVDQYNIRRELKYVGNTYGSWTVLEICKDTGGVGNRPMALCECKCGKKLKISTAVLESSHRNACQSCAETVHGMSGTPTHCSWKNMIDRCYNPNNKRYHRYGGNGVTVCARWLEPNGIGFLNFLTDMGIKPEGKTLDKDKIKPGNKIYCKEFCCWLTPQEQNRHKCDTRLTEQQVIEIRKLIQNGSTKNYIYDLFPSIHRNTLDAVISNRSWKNISSV
jgi:hypothetical protein